MRSCAKEPKTRPRIFIYPDTIGIPPFSQVYNQRLSFLVQRIQSSSHYTTNGECADFFLLNNYVGPQTSSAWVVQLFARVARECKGIAARALSLAYACGCCFS